MIETPPCATPETLAAYLDGKLPPAERAQVERHLAACEECFELLAAAAAFQSEEMERGVIAAHPSARPRPVRWIAAAAAAAALVTLGLWLRQSQSGSTGGAPDMLAWAERLGGQAALKAAAANAWSDGGGALGFGSGLPAAKRAFRVGVHLLDARVALAAREPEHLLAAVDRAASLLPDDDAAEAVQRLRSARAAAADPAAIPGLRQELDQLATLGRAIDAGAFELGAWAETGRLACLGGNTDLLSPEFAALLGRSSGSPAAADPAVAQELDAIRDALADRQVSAQELTDLERSFDWLLLLN